MTKYKLGIFASAAGDMSQVLPKAMEVAKILGDHAAEVIIMTGAGTGLPYEIAKHAAGNGVEVWGYSDSFSFDDHQRNYPAHDLSIYTKLVYLPEAFSELSVRARRKCRNVISTGACDVGMIISGRWGSLNEFTNLIDQEKLVGVLTGTGGIADELPALTQKISKEGQGSILFDDEPRALVEKILSSLKSNC